MSVIAAPSLYQTLPIVALETRLLAVSREIEGVGGVENFRSLMASDVLVQPFVSILVTS